MTNNYQKPVDGGLQALIADCQAEIAELENRLTSWGEEWVPYLKSKLKRQNAALAALMAEPVSDGWIKCSERLPPIGQRVLIPTSGLGEAIEAVRFESNKFNRFGIEVVADYWMPLPAAPGGQDE